MLVYSIDTFGEEGVVMSGEFFDTIEFPMFVISGVPRPFHVDFAVLDVHLGEVAASRRSIVAGRVVPRRTAIQREFITVLFVPIFLFGDVLFERFGCDHLLSPVVGWGCLSPGVAAGEQP